MDYCLSLCDENYPPCTLKFLTFCLERFQLRIQIGNPAPNGPYLQVKSPSHYDCRIKYF
jgi:hypothetical protein